MTKIVVIKGTKRKNRARAKTSANGASVVMVNTHVSGASHAIDHASLLGGDCKVERLIDIHAGNKFRRDGFDRRLHSRKAPKRDLCRQLDFALYPVTGNARDSVSYKMVKSNSVYVDLHNKETDREALQAELNKLLADKPRHFVFVEEENKDGEMVLVERNNLGTVTLWEIRVKALRARLQDKPMPVVLSSARELVELDVHGNANKVAQPKALNPLTTPANGRMLRPAFNKTEPTEIGSTLLLNKCVSDPLRKAANSHLKELPLKLALYLICVQEGLDPVKEYGVTSIQAEEMLAKLHERN